MKPQTSAFNTITPFCRDSKPFYLKFILLSTQKSSYSHQLNAILLVIEYCQLISQIFLLMSHFDSDNDSNTIYSTIFLVSKGFSVGNIINEDISVDSLIKIITPLTVLFFLKCALLINCLFVAAKETEEDSILLKAWRFIVKSHSRVGYLFWTSFYVRIIFILSKKDLNEGTESVLIGWCITMISLEFLLAVVFQTFFTYCLPTKDLLASKSNIIETITLFQKLLIQILEVSLIPYENLTICLFALSNLLFCLTRDFCFLRTLPFYKIKALSIQLWLLMPISCLNFTYRYLIFGLLRSFAGEDTDINSNIVTLVWALLTLLALKLGSSYMNGVLCQLVTSSDKYPTKILIHKIILIKKLIKFNVKDSKSEMRPRWARLLRACCMDNIVDVLNISGKINSSEELNLQSKESFNQMLVLYLETLIQKFPGDNFIKLYLAYFYSKKCHLVGLGMLVIVGIRGLSSSLTTKLNVSRLKYEIQVGLITQQKAESGIDLPTYITSVLAADKLKETMVNQAKFQIKLCNEIIQSAPNLSDICSYSEKITQSRSKIDEQAKNIMKSIPEYFVEPLKLLAHYYLTLNHSMESYRRYMREYNNKSEKYKQAFEEGWIRQENVFQKDNIVLALSGRKEDLAKIIYRSSAVMNKYGEEILGLKCEAIAQPILQKFYQSAFQNMLQRGDTAITGKIIPGFYHSQGVCIPTSFYIELIPFLSQDLYYFVMVRDRIETSELIVLNEDGIIDSCTKKVGHELEYLPLPAVNVRNPIHISLISKDLELMNQAVNLVMFPEKYKPTDDENKVSIEMSGKESRGLDSSSNWNSNLMKSRRKRARTRFDTDLSNTQAQELYSIYTTEGKDLKLTCLRQPNKSILYNCKVKAQVFGDTLVKDIYLEKVAKDFKTILSKIDGEGIGSRLHNTQVNTDHYDYSSEDEKENGWIDFQKLDSFSSPRDVKSPLILPETTDHLLSTRQDMPQSSRNLLSSQRRLFSQIESHRSHQSQNVSKDERILKAVEEKRRDLGYVQKSSKHSTESKSLAKQAKIAKGFNDAINARTYPKFYIIFLVLWYILLIGILTNQLRLNLTNTTRVENIKANKDIIRISNTRSDALISVHLHMRSLWKLLQLDPTGSLVTPAIIDFIKREVDNLNEANQGLILATANIAQASAREWFLKDIKIYGNSSSYTYETYANSFQAVNGLVADSMKGLLESKVNYNICMRSLEYVIRNTLNDLLIKSDEIGHIMLNTTTNSSQKGLNDLNTSLWSTTSVVIVMTIYFICMTYIQYKSHTSYLIALTKISPKGVENVLKKVNIFRKIIEEDLDFEKVCPEKIMNLDDLKLNNIQSRSKPNQRSSQSVTDKRIARRFWLYGAQTLFLLIVLTIIISINYIMSVKFINSTATMLDRLDFSNDVNIGVSLLITTLFEFLTNPNNPDNIYIYNVPVQDEMTNQQQTLTSLISKFPEHFPQNGPEYNPAIQEIISENPCKYITVNAYQSICQTVASGSNNTGIIRVLNNLELYVQTALDQSTYISTYPQQLQVIMRDLALRAICASFQNLINQQFDTILMNTATNLKILNGTIISALLIICVVVHVFVLRRIGETGNTFKRILQAFPAPLILSNFVLKSFLLKSSKGALSAVKNDI